MSDGNRLIQCGVQMMAGILHMEAILYKVRVWMMAVMSVGSHLKSDGV